jgi:hypothetical protein
MSVSGEALTMYQLNDDSLMMEFDGFVRSEDGTRKEFELPVLVGDVRRWRDDPDRCTCKDCMHVFPIAVEVLAAFEDHHAGRITDRQMERRLKRLGWVRDDEEITLS